MFDPLLAVEQQQEILRAALKGEDVDGPGMCFDLEIVSRAYEEGYMQEAVAEEEVCVRGEHCEIAQMARASLSPLDCARLEFSGKRFVYPSGRTCSLCIICLRTQTSLWFLQRLAAGIDPPFCIHAYQNIVGVGEYTRSSCLMPWGGNTCGVVAPIVRHVRSNYDFVVDEQTARRRLEQRVPDFCQASSQGAAANEGGLRRRGET